MEEQTSWKGHSFTLLVFGGIVFLCSIFFVLGVLVGRGQGQRSADAAVAVAAAKAVAAAETRVQSQEGPSAISRYEGVQTGKQTAGVAAPEAAAKPDPPAVAAEAKKEDSRNAPSAKPAPAPLVPVKMIYLQVGALEKEVAANEERAKLEKSGFPALVVQTEEGSKKLYKIHIGPFSNAADADSAKRKLESLGYKPIRK